MARLDELAHCDMPVIVEAARSCLHNIEEAEAQQASSEVQPLGEVKGLVEEGEHGGEREAEPAGEGEEVEAGGGAPDQVNESSVSDDE